MSNFTLNKVKNVMFFVIFFLFINSAFSKDEEDEQDKESKIFICEESEYSELYKEVQEKQRKYILYSLSDIVSTELALSNGGVELNPVGVTGTILAKIGMYMYTENLKNECKKQSLEDSKKALRTFSSLLGGAATNNFLVYFGATPPVAVLSGIVYFFYTFNKS